MSSDRNDTGRRPNRTCGAKHRIGSGDGLNASGTERCLERGQDASTFPECVGREQGRVDREAGSMRILDETCAIKEEILP